MTTEKETHNLNELTVGVSALFFIMFIGFTIAFAVKGVVLGWIICAALALVSGIISYGWFTANT